MTGVEAAPEVPRRRVAAWGLVALGLVGLVAMESHGAAWSPNRGHGARPLPDALVLATMVFAVVAGIGVFLVLVVSRGLVETEAQRKRRWRSALVLVAVFVALVIARQFMHPRDAVTPSPGSSASGTPSSVAPASPSAPARTPATWWPLAIVGLATVLAYAAATVRRAPAPSEPIGPDDAGAVGIIDASLDDLRSEPDARRAVIAAYRARRTGACTRRVRPSPVGNRDRVLATRAGRRR